MSDPAFQSHTAVEQPRTIDDPEKYNAANNIFSPLFTTSC